MPAAGRILAGSRVKNNAPNWSHENHKHKWAQLLPKENQKRPLQTYFWMIPLILCLSDASHQCLTCWDILIMSVGTNFTQHWPRERPTKYFPLSLSLHLPIHMDCDRWLLQLLQKVIPSVNIHKWELNRRLGRRILPRTNPKHSSSSSAPV